MTRNRHSRPVSGQKRSEVKIGKKMSSDSIIANIKRRLSSYPGNIDLTETSFSENSNQHLRLSLGSFNKSVFDAVSITNYLIVLIHSSY